MFGETARISIMVDGDQRAMGVEKGTSPVKVFRVFSGSLFFCVHLAIFVCHAAISTDRGVFV